MQRKFGGFMKRSDDGQDVGTVLAEFKAVDEMLSSVRLSLQILHRRSRMLTSSLTAQLIKDLKSYRNTWEDILRYQYDCSEALANLYKPIDPPPPPEHPRHPTETPQKYMHKCLGLQKLYSDAKADLAQELTMIDRRLVRPAEEAKQCTKGMQKTLKHRENTKLDYERYLSRAEHVRKKETRSVKEEAALTVHESNLAQAQIDYETADEQVVKTFPPVTAAIISLLPRLLASQVMLQTTLVGQLYTLLDAFCKRNGLPSPAPSDAEILRVWDSEFTAFRKELEQGISTIANGKVVNMSMALPEKKEGTVTGLGLRNKVMNRKASGQSATAVGVPERPMIGSRQSSGAIAASAYNDHEAADEPAPPKPPRPGQQSPLGMAMPSPSVNMASKPRISSASSALNPSSWPDHPPPTYDQASSTPASHYQTPFNGIATPFTASSAPDYFSQPEKQQPSPQTRRTSSTSTSAASVAKKKPPPPVPAKRIPSAPQAQYVTALFDFEGQGGGDLAFREGDRIKVVRRTESTDDWWEGELRGRVGSFPANYVEV